jgi:hypothetical protein
VHAQGPTSPLDSLAARIDPFVAKLALLVLTDIANEPDDQMSLVRLLVYSNRVDIEGLIASTSTWMKRAVRPDVIRTVLDAYEKVQPNLLKHEPGFPTAEALRALVSSGQPGYGMDAVGPDKMSAGAELIIRAADRNDPRPLWVTAWGGANTLAQALLHVRATRTPAQLEQFVAKLRVYAISDQDDAGPWLRKEFPTLMYVNTPSTQDGAQYYFATWTGISGDRFYRNAPARTSRRSATRGSTRTSAARVRSARTTRAVLHPRGRHAVVPRSDRRRAGERDEPGVRRMGRRYVWRQFYGETRPHWTQGGDSYPGTTTRATPSSARTARRTSPTRRRSGAGATTSSTTSRRAWLDDRAVRTRRTTIRSSTVNGRVGDEPLRSRRVSACRSSSTRRDTKDPDGNALRYEWFFYAEAGGASRAPVASADARPPRRASRRREHPSAPVDGPPQPPPRVTIDGASSARAVVTPRVAGVAHVILAVRDNGAPTLTSYRRVILTIAP